MPKENTETLNRAARDVIAERQRKIAVEGHSLLVVFDPPHLTRAGRDS